MDLERALKRSLFAIPSINGGSLLARMLPTLGIPADLVVVLDQGSTDDTEEVCRLAGVRLLQLGRPHTYTEACNVGARLARERGADFVFVSNNDITFATDVVRELLRAMLDDPGLGIVAPSQMLIDEKIGQRLLTYRVFWHLGAMQFAHDVQAPGGDAERLEADFCELTCALVRVSAIEEVGFLDDEYGFYHEDADFGFRLRQAGYTCAYAPQAQIEHYTSSTFSAAGLSERKLSYIAKNKALFARKHLGFGVTHQDHRSTEANSWSIINRHLHPYLHRNGLISPGRPELIFSHPGTEPFDYLYTVWETTALPTAWIENADAYKGVFVTSEWNKQVFERAGYRNVHYVPLGIETDVFHPWGASQRPFTEKTFLWFSRNQHRKALDVTLKAWAEFRRCAPDAKLIVMGVGVLGCIGHAPASSRRWKGFIIADYPEDGISVRETITPLTDDELATLYRGVDFVVSNSRSEGFGFVIAEAMACGTVPIFSGYGASREFGFEGAMMLRGREVPADYSDKGFGDVGNWWEPDVEHLTELLRDAYAMDPATRRRLAREGTRVIRNRFTWRSTCTALRAALTTLQEQRLVLPPALPEPAEAAVVVTEDLVEVPPVPDEPIRDLRPADGPDREPGLDPAATAEIPVQPRPDLSGWVPRNLDRVALVGREFGAVRRDAGTCAALRVAGRRVGGYASSRFAWAGRRIGLLGEAKAPVPATPHGGAPDIELEAEPPRATPAANAVLFVGYVEAGLGLGESLRGLVTAVAGTALPFAVYPFNVNVETRLIGPFMPERYDRDARYDVNVAEMAADQLPGLFQELGERRTRDSYNILRTYWELTEAPRAWAPLLGRIDEIWAPNDFVARAFRSVFDGPIMIVPPCVEIGAGNGFGRAQFGMERDRFYFMFSFDYFSFPARKNPLGVLRAFQAAFPDLDQNVGLVIKSTSAVDQHPEVKAEIAAAARRDRRIVVIDRTMSREEMLALIRQSDCYVSLHRSEGFGLGMAEAMAFGNSVIGTDYSGSTDFLSERTGFPVRCVMRPLRPDEYVFTEGQSWAEPDGNDAVVAMRRVVEDREERRRRAAAGRLLIENRYGRENVGRIAERRLMHLLAQRRRLRGD